jgi:hypothetical protein
MMRLAAYALCWTLCACAGTETGNPSFMGKLGYDAYSSDPGAVALALKGDAAEALTVDNAWLVLGDVELQRGTDCDSASGPHVHGLGAGDHAGGQAPPTDFETSAGDFCGLRLPFAPASGALPDGAPESLKDESVFVRGKLPDGRMFEVHSALQESLSLRATAGEFVLDSAHANIVIGFDVALWLSELRWADATETSEDTVMVSRASNRALLDQFEAALPKGIALFRDHDGDGELDDDAMKLAASER